ncbi:hypothetical protein [Falsirhodobacter deserti]|uniref:hypothetical protein n=1 Tax=Falsirhodobacter deserti TaxID=1365611 RepID=UPI0013E2BFC2|nr:hypothetical protein [Falsirhodobacter deserti]
MALTGDPVRAEALIAEGHPWQRADAWTFGWLDDLAELGDERSGRFAAGIIGDWVLHYGRGEGWTPESTGPRLLHWLAHARFIYPRGVPLPAMEALARQAEFLRLRWRATRGWARVAALAGLSAAAHALDRPALRPAGIVLPDLPRDPDGLVRALVLMLALRETWPNAPVHDGIASAVNALRAMRHADGRLTRLTGGSGGDPLQLDAALALAHIRQAPPPQAMGLSRLARGGSTVIADPDRFELASRHGPIVTAGGILTANGASLPGKLSRVSVTQAAITTLHDGTFRIRLPRECHLALSADGGTLHGTHILTPKRRRFRAPPLSIRFLLDPRITVQAAPDRILLTLPEGEQWAFTAPGAQIDTGGIVLQPQIGEWPARFDWTFSRSGDTPARTRDLPHDPGAIG